MKNVNLAVIGAGNIGTKHIAYLSAGNVVGCTLYAICDIDPKRLLLAREKFKDQYKLYGSVKEVLEDDNVDAVLISTPHYDHPLIAIEAMKANKHVLIEKPAGVYTKTVREMNAVAEKNPHLTFGIMYNQRTNPMYRRIRELVQSGELGEIRRTNWIITTWYRSQSYYDSGGWRATWKGEGGGVLLNQDPHQLDLWQWICGMPSRVYSLAYFGKHRDIEVEDEVTAIVEYPNKATGVFITSVSETPGTNRFEIVGSKGKLVMENEELKFSRCVVDEADFNKNYTGGFGEPEVWNVKLPVIYDNKNEHQKIMQNFINHILYQEELIAPGVEGIYGLTISNAIHMSAWNEQFVDIGFDEDEFYHELKKRMNSSVVKEVEGVVLNTESTY